MNPADSRTPEAPRGETKKRWPWPTTALDGDRSPCTCGHYLGSHDGVLPHRCWVAGCSCRDFDSSTAPSGNRAEWGMPALPEPASATSGDKALDDEQVARLQNMAAPCCELDTDGDGDCPRHRRYAARFAPSGGTTKCEHCNGRGSHLGMHPPREYPCSHCGGDGVVASSAARGEEVEEVRTRLCPTCSGSGRLPGYSCRDCGGSGVQSYFRDEVKQPAPSGETLPEDDITCDEPVCFRRLVPEDANLDGRNVSECRACGALFYADLHQDA